MSVKSRTARVTSSTRLLATFTKSVADVLDYAVDWSTWLSARNDTISTSTVTAPGGITKNSDTSGSRIQTAFIQGGTAATSYDIVFKIVTAQGRTKDQSIFVVVAEA